MPDSSHDFTWRISVRHMIGAFALALTTWLPSQGFAQGRSPDGQRAAGTLEAGRHSRPEPGGRARRVAARGPVDRQIGRGDLRPVRRDPRFTVHDGRVARGLPAAGALAPHAAHRAELPLVKKSDRAKRSGARTRPRGGPPSRLLVLPSPGPAGGSVR